MAAGSGPPACASAPLAQERDAEQERPEGDREEDGADHVHPRRRARRVPAGGGRPADGQRRQPDGHVDVEDVPPGGRQEVRDRLVEQAQPGEGRRRLDRVEDRRPEKRPGGHPQERQRADHAERTGAIVALEEVGCGRRGHRDQRAAPQRLDGPGGDQLVERLGHPGQQRAQGEEDEGAEEEAPRTPGVRQATREGHRPDVDEEVGVDDPAGVAELGPAAQVGDDRRERDRGDHQLEPGQEDAGSQDGEQHERDPAVHARSVGPRRCRLRPAAGPAACRRCILSSMGSEAGLEIERKYLLAGAPAASDLAALGARSTSGSSRPTCARRTSGCAASGGPIAGGPSATCSRASATWPASCARSSRTDLTADEYARLLADADPARRVIRKTRHVFSSGRWTLELDVFDEPPGLVLLEVELDDAADVPELPPGDRGPGRARGEHGVGLHEPRAGAASARRAGLTGERPARPSPR